MSSDQQRIERARELLMRALDDELDQADVRELDLLLSADPEMRDEWERLMRLKEVTSNMKLRKPPEAMWDGYWNSVYSRLERGVAWILVSLGAILLGSYGAWYGVKDLIADTELPFLVKGGILALIVGLVILLVSVLRHRIFVSQTDPYKEIER